MNKRIIGFVALLMCGCRPHELAPPRQNATVECPPCAGGTPRQGPVVFYSDLTNGPKTGGENNLGVYVTVNGKGFGAAQGTSMLTVGGGVTTIKSWSDTQIVFQPGPGAVTGPIVATVGGTPSTCYPTGKCDFLVRPGRIFCVSNAPPAGSGADSHDGKFSSDPSGNSSGCWATLSTVFKTRMTAGDTVYVAAASGETFQTTPADRSHPAYIFLYSSSYPGIPKTCTQTNSCAIVGYPGATAIIGGEDGPGYGSITYTLRNPGGYDFWTFSNLHFLASTASTVQASTVLIERSHGWRVINNEVTMPSSSSAAAINADKLGTTDHQRDLFLYGNYVHKVSSRAPYNARRVHYIYLTCDANDVEIAWNHLDGSDSANGSCRGIHVHSSPFDSTRTDGFPQHGISIHDNLVEHIGCNAVDLTSGDPDESKGGGFWVYDNILNDVGNGRGVWPDLPTCAPILTSMNVSSDYNWQYTTGVMHFVHNTIYDPGGSPCAAYQGQRGVFATQPLSHPWCATCFHPQNPSTLCQTSGCNHARWTGNLTLDPSPSLGLFPGMNNFTARAGGTVAAQQVYDTGFTYKCAAGLIPDDTGPNTCAQLFQGGIRANGSGSAGALNLTTGAYDFAFQTVPATNSTVVYLVTQPFKLDVSNNIFYVKSGTPWYWGAESYLTEQRRILTGSNNLFYSLQDPQPPANIPGLPPPFSANIGNNADPLFISNGSDFHLQPASIARAAGMAIPRVTHDYDARVRPQEIKAAVGSYEFIPAEQPQREQSLAPLMLLAVTGLILVGGLGFWWGRRTTVQKK